MKKVIIKLNRSELQTLYTLLKTYIVWHNTDIEIMAFFILQKVYQRLFTRLCNQPENPNKEKKFTLKQGEAVALRIFLNMIYGENYDDYSNNVSLRIINTINQQLS